MASKTYGVFVTAQGWMAVATTETGICGLVVPRESAQEAERTLVAEHPDAVVGEHLPWGIESLLPRYAGGEDVDFSALPLDLSEGTPFQQSVWEAARRIPYGQVQTYNQLAQALGMPGASRAVGHALGANPVPILVPCHRVVGSDGRLHGFKGGVHLKIMLLACEGRMLLTGASPASR